MPYDEHLAERLTPLLTGKPGFEQKKMFGGIGWLCHGNMCVGIYKEFLITRVGLEAAETLLQEPHVRPMDITGKVMKGWLMIAPAGVTRDLELKRHVELASHFVKTLPAK